MNTSDEQRLICVDIAYARDVFLLEQECFDKGSPPLRFLPEAFCCERIGKWLRSEGSQTGNPV